MDGAALRTPELPPRLALAILDPRPSTLALSLATARRFFYTRVGNGAFRMHVDVLSKVGFAGKVAR